ncbi:putative sporulation protein YyaC [Caloramator fervidus]|uniref:Putative sporulation protein YyaC n=1 Tax=Caloramator fervidus TaxID=29344 RepID=A0A1H5WG36_9CLOT|nr:spore protease YyaC [Caloramator fervidus]SEF98444.1 putative sporulation protein YyaC [Caloramator fervidus]
MLQEKKLQISIESDKPHSPFILSNEITNLIKDVEVNRIVILCIGTDRSTGDCLGPLVGDKLTKSYNLKEIDIYGTLETPVHAKNLNNYIEMIYSNYKNPYIIAIDASLGKVENIGKINLYQGPIFPGAGVNKNLTPVGDISITGIVNMSGFMEYFVLQNTRLSLVMKMADVISFSLYLSLKKLYLNSNITIR